MIDLLSPSLTWWDTSGTVVLEGHYPEFERFQMFVDEMWHFLAAIRSEEPVSVDLLHAIDTLQFPLAIRRALKSGEFEHFN